MEEKIKTIEELNEEVFEYFGEDIPESNDHFENYRKNIITTIAYLLGVPDDKFGSEGRFDLNEYEKLKKNDDATVIHYLSRLRTQFLRNYKAIDDARKYSMTPLEMMTDYLDIHQALRIKILCIEI